MKRVKKLEDLPLREQLSKEDYQLTKDIDENLFKEFAETKEELANGDDEGDHIFKVPSLESFRSQKIKSSKVFSPNSSGGEDTIELHHHWEEIILATLKDIKFPKIRILNIAQVFH